MKWGEAALWKEIAETPSTLLYPYICFLDILFKEDFLKKHELSHRNISTGCSVY